MRQRDFPKELLIGDNIWRVKFVRKIPDDNPYCVGLCDPSLFIIYIKTGMTFEERIEIFAHELTHAFCFEYGFDIKHKHIYKLGEAVARLYVDNF